MARRASGKKWYEWLALVTFVVSIGAFVYNQFFLSPKAKIVEGQLERELSLIKPYPRASLTRSEQSHKGRQALVTRRYNTTAGYQDLRKYYEAELENHGWRFVSEKSVYHWWRDFGGKTAHYCKGGLSADIEYMGQDNAGVGDYVLSLS